MKRRGGLTLAEVIVAMGLLAAAGLGLLSAFTAGLKLMQQSVNVSMATDLGREVLERIKIDGYQATRIGHFDGRIPSPAREEFPPAPYPKGLRNEQEYRFRVRCSQYSPICRLVQVEVFWGRTHQTSLATMVHR